MSAVLEVVAHRSGPWLVKAGEFLYAVPPGLGRALRPLAGRRPADRELRDCLGAGPLTPEIETWVGELNRALGPPEIMKMKGRRVGGPIRFRVPVIPARWVRPLADRLQSLTGNRSLAALTLLGMAGFLGAGSGQVGFSWDLGILAAGLGLFLLSALWHELGHAAALARSGYPAGGIGAGYPVRDPGAVRRRHRRGRPVPNGSAAGWICPGWYSRLAAGGLFMAVASVPTIPAGSAQILALAGSSALLAVTWSLFPFIRSDGYWLLCDLLMLDDLDRPPRELPKPGRRVFLVGYQLANALFLLLIAIFFPWRIFGLLLALAHRWDVSTESFTAKWLAAAAGVLFLGLMGVGITRRMTLLVRSAIKVARGY